jgi:ATP/maltotriose-dependent transcriptional regulator MalT
LVTAPAGYGKTSALVDFAQHSPVRVCWYTADERDRDLSVFIQYLADAIAEQFPGFGQRVLEKLDAPETNLFRDPTALVGEIVNEILEIDEPLALVMDNYEVLEGAYGIRAFVHPFLENLPPNCHVMLGSRVLPNVPITKLVAKRQLVGLTAQDLRFTPEEVHALLQLLRLDIPQAQAEAIATNSGGWITGVLLLADMLRKEAEVRLFGEEQATTDTYDYLAQEVLNRQDPAVQQFLISSAVLREMTVRLCRDVLAIEPLLSEVERRNLFVTRFGRGAAATYRYHNLFRDFLHDRLRQRAPTRYRELHLGAARHFEDEWDVEEAIYHYTAAASYNPATELMERVVMERFTRGQVETLLRWVDALPEDIKPKAPRLCLYVGKVLTDRYDYTLARQALAYAEGGFTEQGDMTRLAKVHVQRATLALFESRYEAATTEAQLALDMLSEEDIVERAHAQRSIGRAYIGLGRIAEGITELQCALALFQQVSSQYDIVNLLQDLTLAFTAQGQLEEARQCMSEALTIARRLGATTPLAAVLNNMGWLYHAQGEYRHALALYEEGLGAARRGDDLRWQAYLSAGIADLYRDVGQYDRADPLYNTTWKMTRDSEPGLAVYALRSQTDMYRWQKNDARAQALLREARRLAEEKRLDFEVNGLLPLSEGIVAVEGGKVEEGLSLLSNAIQFLEGRQEKHDLARAYFLRAEAHLAAGEQARAATDLRRSLDLAAETGTDQFAVVEGRHALELLDLGTSAGVEGTDVVRKRALELAAFDLDSSDQAERTLGLTTERLEIYALGRGQVVRDGHELTSAEWQGAMVKELFFYILFYGPLKRDDIGLVFWPDLSTKRMTDSFHTTLYRIRRALGADVVVVENGEYRIGDVDYWIDVEAFETLVERARLLPIHDWHTEDLWRRAVALYKGDFLTGVDRAWAILKREALSQMYVEALIGVGQCLEAQREFEAGIEWYRRALQIDSFREETYQRIMSCYAEAGRRTDALAAYYECERVLREELGIEPSPSTKRLYTQIVGKRPD